MLNDLSLESGRTVIMGPDSPRVGPRILTVGIAKNGMECMNFINKTRADVVLLDINLPDICGLDLIKLSKKINEYPSLWLWLVTSIFSKPRENLH